MTGSQSNWMYLSLTGAGFCTWHPEIHYIFDFLVLMCRSAVFYLKKEQMREVIECTSQSDPTLGWWHCICGV